MSEAEDEEIGQRIVVVGSSGSGKTTLAKQLSQRLGIPHVELDALHWEANWTEASDEVLRARAEAALQGNGWTADGNYSKLRDIIWVRAETIVWLDYPLRVLLPRLLRRTIIRGITKEELWNGNRERLTNLLKWNDENIVQWSIKSRKKHRHEYPILFTQPQYQHLNMVRLRHPRETVRWLAEIKD